MTKLEDIGEHELLAIISQYCDRKKIGDDGAILDVNTDKKLVITTDVLVENVHFSDDTTPPHSIGYRAAAANLSDIAAMGATPIAFTVGLSLRKDVEISWIKSVYQGIQQCLQKCTTKVVGGDITKSEVNAIAITALGEVKENEVIYRHTAREGDLILTTGLHGLSRAGLEILLYPQKYGHIDNETRKKVIFAHQYPEPRLDVIKLLKSINPYPKVTGMDSSDGLADAIIQICQKSNVGATINRRKIVIPSAIKKITNDETAWDWILYGGEDFELVLCMNEETAQYLQKRLGKNCHIIGEISASSEIQLVDPENVYPKLLLNQRKTFQHF
ncbi:MAG: thiamine-phosphate kinase [Cyanobacteria bacterium]|nr:thiamine-phosphate kinase [Cyanobacteria bacterium CG_2015-16_32_12]NCO76738.1 thiamine-phosphate kinase [Cyanobacteria bacterium CG_2015-22_32_23]NCQ04384.1 thiamine-phosphate kinase [Cyanobacteria bacterium CG_2015-09_32_10]NCQ42996.1 thiamine-phosphate kinase [Cyanobacteria bacterium CG_2015-04_32_10]NCS84401.1 thiamine-phosphate kinase [Cyanobacteria bacterium CG_2015-02_32_10]